MISEKIYRRIEGSEFILTLSIWGDLNSKKNYKSIVIKYQSHCNIIKIQTKNTCNKITCAYRHIRTSTYIIQWQFCLYYEFSSYPASYFCSRGWLGVQGNTRILKYVWNMYTDLLKLIFDHAKHKLYRTQQTRCNIVNNNIMATAVIPFIIDVELLYNNCN